MLKRRRNRPYKTVKHKKYGRVRVLAKIATDRGGLALVKTRSHGTFWVRARSVGRSLFLVYGLRDPWPAHDPA